MKLDMMRRDAKGLLIAMAVLGAAAFAIWTALINNFAVEIANFRGNDIGILQSVREIPGFLAFTAVYLLLFITEQRFAMISLVLLAAGTAITGLFPTLTGLLITTTIMSIGFHYYETINQSLALQWLSKKEAPKVLGQLIAARSFASILAMALVWIAFQAFGASYNDVYLFGGGLIVILIIAIWVVFPKFEEKVPQHKKLILRKRYWVYYALTFLSGARRQIFVVFAGFLLVEKFDFSIQTITALYVVNAVINVFFAPIIGSLISRIGERKMLIIEYCGLIAVFTSYALAPTGWFAAGLYIIDHLFFAMAIAIKTYFQKIADPQDMASSAAVSFTINHIAAVFIPVLFGLLWLISPAAVFLIGAFFAFLSLLLSLLVPNNPSHENYRRFLPLGPKVAPAE